MKPIAMTLAFVLPLVGVLHACSSSDGAKDATTMPDPDPDPGTGTGTGTGAAEDDSASGAAGSAGSGASEPGLTVTGPIGGGMGVPFTSAFVDLASFGYGEKEFFFAGEATAYALQGEMSMDGKWALAEASTAPFKSRMLVRRPNDAAKFNGTVVVEWLNVSAGADGDPGFMYNWQELLREGYVWVGVSAQAVGIEGGGFSLVASTQPLKQYDPDRYGTLSHPGDAYSFDVYTQAALVIRGAGDLDVLEGLVPQRLIAYGESQSAMRMVSYVNGVQPLAKAYDGFFIHSRMASGVPFGGDAGLGLPLGGAPALIRGDLDARVFQFQTETDVVNYLAARQPDTDTLRTWEVAGTAHADQYLLDLGEGREGGVQCEGANDGPQHYVLKGALHALDLWLTDGTEPARGEPLMITDAGALATDEHGNTLGGVRTPAVDVPIATLSGQPAAGGDFICFLFGYTTPFTEEELAELYPTHDAYVTKVREAAREAREANFILEPEEAAMVEEAESAKVPK